MADNFATNAGSGGDTFAADDILGVKYPRSKITIGIDGVNDGDVSATNPLPVTSTTLATAALQTTGNTALSTLAAGVKLTDTLGNSTNSAATGFLKVTDEPRQIFYDSFDTALDVANQWAATSGSSGVAPSVALGVLTMGTGTAAGGYSKLASLPTFKPVIPGWIVFSDAVALPDGAAPIANSYRYWGTGTTPATPSVSTPVTDGYGFEVGIDGKMRAVVYAGGVQTVIADLSTSGTSKQPLNATNHRYIIQVRTDRTFYYIDTIDSNGLVASTSFQSPQLQILPKLFICIGNSTPPVSNVQFTCTGAVVSDTGKNATLIADATFPWRRAAVSAAGALSVNMTGAATAANQATEILSLATIGEALTSTAGDSLDTRSLFDLLDTNHPDYIRLGTAPAGIDQAGQAPASQSFPVALANEQILDKVMVGWPLAPGSLGKNALADKDGGSWIDCSQYRSIAFQTSALAGQSVTLVFEGSNDGLNAVAMPMFDMAAPTTAPVTTVAQTASTQRFWAGPLMFRYFRARVSVAVVGGFSAYTILRMAGFTMTTQQIANSALNWSSNIAQINGSAPPTAGVAGTLEVGGSVATGTAATLFPMQVAGTDSGAGGTSTARVRTLLTDVNGLMQVVGAPRGMRTDSPAVQFAESPNLPEDLSIAELLHQVLLELKCHSHYLKELPYMLNQGSSFTDEPDAIKTDLSKLQ